MGINKNFVVKNGLEVDSDLILANAITNRVGIGTSLPTTLLHVNGGIAATHISVSGVTTVNSLQLNGSLSIGDTYGGSFQYLRATGAGGVEWAPLPELRNSVSYVALSGQTEFTFAPTAAYVDVYINGVKQSEVNYIWTNGLKIELIDAAFGGDIIEIIGYNTNTVGSGGSGFGTVIGGITVLESGTLRGSAGLITSINFVGPTVGVTTSGFGVTVYSAGGGGGESLWESTATGIHTLSNIGIGTTNSPYKLTVSGNAYVSGAATVLGPVTLGITSVGTYSTQRSLYVNGGITATGVVTAPYYEGDGSRLTNISAQAVDTGWDRQALSGLTTSVNIGIGTTNARYQLEVGAIGDSGLQALINGDLYIAGNVYSTGVATATKFETDTQNISIQDSTINSPSLITIGGTAVRVLGNFYVNGTQFITTSVSLQLNNKIIGLGTTTASPNDISADGGGILLYGDTNKEFLWNYTDDAWNSNVNIGISTTKTLKIGGQDRLSYDSLTVPNANISGVSTIGTVSAGIITASTIYSSEYTGNGNGLSGIVTSIIAGENISVTNSVGRVIISAAGGGGGGGSSVSIGDSAPATPSSGNLWWDSDAGRGFIYYVDNDGAQWVDFSPNGGVPANAIYVKNNDVPLPQAISTLNFNGNVSISTSLSGIATIGINTVVIGTYTQTAGIATTATYAISSGIATYAITSGISTYTAISGISTNVIGGIGSVTQLYVSGISTIGIATFTSTVSFGSSAYFGDVDSLYFGDGNDLQIYHDGSHSYVKDAATGNLYLETNGSGVIVTKTGSENLAKFLTDGAVELYYDNVKEFETTGYGATVYGTLQSQGLNVTGISTFTTNVNFVGVSTNIFFEQSTNSFNYGDNAKAYFGSNLDLEIFGNSTYSTIQEKSGGSKKLYVVSDDLELRSYNTFELYLSASANSSVSLYYDNSKKFETLGVGVTITGTTFTDQLTVGTSGTVITTTSNGLVGIGTTNPTDKLTIQGGDISVGVGTDNGLVLTSPNGTRFRLVVSDSGVISTVQI